MKRDRENSVGAPLKQKEKKVFKKSVSYKLKNLLRRVCEITLLKITLKVNYKEK
jgi:hypothetical protein